MQVCLTWRLEWRLPQAVPFTKASVSGDRRAYYVAFRELYKLFTRARATCPIN